MIVAALLLPVAVVAGIGTAVLLWYVRHRLVYRIHDKIPLVAFNDVPLDPMTQTYDPNMEWFNNIVTFVLNEYWNNTTENDILLFLNAMLASSLGAISQLQYVNIKELTLRKFRPGIASINSKRLTNTRLLVDTLIQLRGSVGIKLHVKAINVKTFATVKLKDMLIPFRIVVDYSNKIGDGEKIAPALLTVPTANGSGLTLLTSLPLVTMYVPLEISYHLKLSALAPGVGTIIEQVIQMGLGTIRKYNVTLKCDKRLGMTVSKAKYGEPTNGKEVKVKIQKDDGSEGGELYALHIEKGIPAELRDLDDAQLLQLVEKYKKAMDVERKANMKRRLQGIGGKITDNAGVRAVKGVGDKTLGGMSKVGHGIGHAMGIGRDPAEKEAYDVSDAIDNEGADVVDEESTHKSGNPFKRFAHKHRSKKRKDKVA